MKPYNNEDFNKLYETFLKMYQEEGGDVYLSLVKSINDDVKSSKIPSTIHKTVILQILDKASVDHFLDKISIIEEKDFEDEFEF